MTLSLFIFIHGFVVDALCFCVVLLLMGLVVVIGSSWWLSVVSDLTSTQPYYILMLFLYTFSNGIPSRCTYRISRSTWLHIRSMKRNKIPNCFNDMDTILSVFWYIERTLDYLYRKKIYVEPLPECNSLVFFFLNLFYYFFISFLYFLFTFNHVSKST